MSKKKCNNTKTMKTKPKMHKEKIGNCNCVVTTWHEDVNPNDTPSDLRKRRESYEDQLPSMGGYGWRITSLITGLVSDFTFETEEECKEAYIEWCKPENMLKRLQAELEEVCNG